MKEGKKERRKGNIVNEINGIHTVSDNDVG